jgi:hypothetical protein
VRWLAESLDHGVVAARVGRDDGGLVAEWPGRAHFSVRLDGSAQRFAAEPGADALEVEKLRRGAVPLLLSHLTGGIPLHGSSVAIDGRAVVFLGDTEHGKSTLAAAMCELFGGSLLADDAVVVERRLEGYAVLALEESHWLASAAAAAVGRREEILGEKAPLRARRCDVNEAPLALVAHLSFSDNIDDARVVPVHGLDAVTGLLSQMTRFIVDDPAIARRDLASLADLVERTPIVRLERPRRLDLLQNTARLVVEAAGRGKP